MSWWSRHAASVEAIAATVAALVGVKLQLDTAEQQQQAQSARGSRLFLNSYRLIRHISVMRGSG